MQPIKQGPYGGGSMIRGGGFDPHDRRYTCCGGRMDSRRGAYFVGIVHVVCAIIAIVSLILAYATMHERNYGLQLLASIGSLSIGIVVCLGIIALAVVMWVGIRGGSPVLILPHLVAQPFMIIGLLFVFIVSIVTLIGLSGAVFGPDRYSTSLTYVNDETLHLAEALTSCTLVLSFLGMFVETWFMTIVMSAYRYYVDEFKYNG